MPNVNSNTLTVIITVWSTGIAKEIDVTFANVQKIDNIMYNCCHTHNHVYIHICVYMQLQRYAITNNSLNARLTDVAFLIALHTNLLYLHKRTSFMYLHD